MEALQTEFGLPQEDFKLLFCLKQRNKLKWVAECSPSALLKQRNKLKWVAECSSSAFRTIMKYPKLLLRWESHAITEHFNIKRCFRCQKYGHLQKDCQNHITCANCAQNHDTRDCTSDVLACVNCLNSNEFARVPVPVDHATYYSDCPCYTAHVERIRRLTSYA
ncbi:hypothetical protein X975_13106, partial [Stegodyphus mimosarum]